MQLNIASMMLRYHRHAVIKVWVANSCIVTAVIIIDGTPFVPFSKGSLSAHMHIRNFDPIKYLSLHALYYHNVQNTSSSCLGQPALEEYIKEEN